MGTEIVKFDHSSPAVPTLSRGAKLGASGVSHPSLKTIGILTALSTNDGSFWTQFMDGQIDYDGDGYLYVADELNLRVQRFVKNASGDWIYDSKVLLADALGAGTHFGSIVAIDRTRGEIHIAAKNQTATGGTWIGVWLLSQWPNLTVANRQRSYGSNDNASSGAGKTVQGSVLTIIDNISYVVSNAGDNRVIAWNHLTGALVAERVSTGVQNRLVGTALGLYGGGIQTTGTTPGLWTINTATLAGISRVDAEVANVQARRGRNSNFGSAIRIADIGLYSGRIYVREYNRLMAFRTSDNAFVDEFMSMGASLSGTFLGKLSVPRNESGKYGRIGFWVSPNSNNSDEIIAWANNADNNSEQSWLACIPVSVSSAIWSYTAFAASGTTTLKRILATGKYLSSEKARVSWRKNGGAWHTLTLQQAADSTLISAAGDHTFVAGNTLELRIEMSTWDRLDGDDSLTAVRDNLSPENVNLFAELEDENYVTVPEITADLSVRIEAPEVRLQIDL